MLVHKVLSSGPLIFVLIPWTNESLGDCQGCQLVNSLIILEALIEGFLVRRIYVDGGSSSEVMYEQCFQNLRSKTKAKLKESRTPLVGFSGKNAEATYQRLVDTIFKGQMGQNLEAYVDDMVIKSKTQLEMIKDVKETLLTLKKAIKKLIAGLPTLTAPKKEEELMVYLSTANEAISAILLVEREGRQAPIHYVSKILQGTEINYPPMEKLALALVYAAKRLRRSMSHPDRSGKSRISLCSLTKLRQFKHDAKYEAILVGLRIATKMKVEKMHAFVDSKLVASQVEGSYEAKGEKTKKYKEKALKMIRSFNKFQISHIPREENKKVDALSKLTAVQCKGLTKGVLIDELNERSMDTAEVNAIIKEATRTWMKPIQKYIKNKILTKYATEARTIQKKA
uniref:Reverse transcriptase domain-containing protein n=1 Tax=Tanacetum cinerariifolium TaxID=118510 RepID=A0A6L2MFI6_TANCI|nr:hypothetical protein [Tanacetum cinerariifolium]